jgi:hypothetical protein
MPSADLGATIMAPASRPRRGPTTRSPFPPGLRPAARPAGTWTSWAIALPGVGWEEHDEQAIWEEIDD